MGTACSRKASRDFICFPCWVVIRHGYLWCHLFLYEVFIMYVPKDKNMDEMISEHAINRVARMEIGDVTNCIELFGSAVWYSLTDLEKHYLFMRMVDMLVDEGELDLEIAGVNDAGQTLYERIG
jgi:hypothetical protein